MRKIKLNLHNTAAAILTESNGKYELSYLEKYSGEPLSRALPVDKQVFRFESFPPFLDGLLPEGIQLEALLRSYKIDEEDYLSQIIQVGQDLIGAITIEEITVEEIMDENTL